tara:strand:+ start:936 stop:1484 length:549 start_codon:yes stop_codon:yes gene_type:complete
MVATWILIVIVVVVVLIVVYIYNSLIKLRLRVKNAWSQIDVQLKRRFDLIPNLINTVKGYAKHEEKVLTKVTEMRAGLMQGSPGDRMEASDQLTGLFKSLFAVAENYPDLKANQNFLHLQEELSGTESKIAYARQFYNDSVMKFNEAIQVFPKNLFAKLFGFHKEEFFQTKGKERENVKVQF